MLRLLRMLVPPSRHGRRTTARMPPSPRRQAARRRQGVARMDEYGEKGILNCRMAIFSISYRSARCLSSGLPQLSSNVHAGRIFRTIAVRNMKKIRDNMKNIQEKSPGARRECGIFLKCLPTARTTIF
ncbi:hypothetical protein [Janthinobacterium sp. AD80]|uniref:hypothetical protein n=1 Tax=Janthinobacterium sp. AD80 TaxID=1528773 RepID=UPI0011AED7DF|nr:hypothetical protein [Janthinobacterium sp. AD80]